jgi:phage shock protein C
MTYKKLHKSNTNKVLTGVLGGLGEYFNIDPVLLRVIFAFFVLITGFFPGVVAYFIATLLIPDKPAPGVDAQ